MAVKSHDHPRWRLEYCGTPAISSLVFPLWALWERLKNVSLREDCRWRPNHDGRRSVTLYVTSGLIIVAPTGVVFFRLQSSFLASLLPPLDLAVRAIELILEPVHTRTEFRDCLIRKQLF